MKNKACFNTTAHAKCILAGEHAVLKGCPALVLPVHLKTLTLSCQDLDREVHIDYQHSYLPYEQTFLLFFWETLFEGVKFLKKDIHHIFGRISLTNNIPMGGGIGFSAALCVVIARLFAWRGLINEDQIFSFAKKMENIFHGNSSGLDIAGAMFDQITHFELSGDIHSIESDWQPRLYLSYSGQPKQTAHAVNLVMAFRKAHRALANRLDQEMQDSVLQIEEALQSKKSLDHRLSIFANALFHAHHCFQEWGLITPTLHNHIDELYRMGAIAVKPTGAGEGGYVLSLWKETPPTELLPQLTPIFFQDNLHH